MSRILLLGLDPETVDYSDPALPPGMTAEKVHVGIAVALKQFTDRGWEFDVGFIRPDETAGPTVERQLPSTNYDCVVIGAGVRLPPRNLALFEVIINAIRKVAPGAAIAFNTRPDDSADAAARGLALGVELYSPEQDHLSFESQLSSLQERRHATGDNRPPRQSIR